MTADLWHVLYLSRVVFSEQAAAVFFFLAALGRYVLIQIWSFCGRRKPSCGASFAYVDYLSTAQKIHYAHDWRLWVDTRKATSYFDHFCARIYSAAYADIPTDDCGLPTLDYLHMQASTFGHGCILPTYVDIPKMILAFQHGIICAYEQVPSDLDVFCVRTQIYS